MNFVDLETNFKDLGVDFVDLRTGFVGLKMDFGDSGMNFMDLEMDFVGLEMDFMDGKYLGYFLVSSSMGSQILVWGYRIRVENGLGVLRLLVLSWIIVVHCLDATIEEEGDK
ncbi:hypothetical protein T459_19021 [Capsicum annuum]|uniref:Uncharacterized protein n=1 Tax=Capsicum annuum TaxID=4072 RepID=A0A2G2Z0J3_CAPAN|nr:hypothetical protein T459_19021 [Capsicum annuum]